MQLYVGLDAGHNLFQVLDAVALYAVGLNGVVDTAFNHRAGIHTQGLLAVAVGRNGTGLGVQFGHGEEDIHTGRGEVGLDGLRRGVDTQIHELGNVVVREVREHDAGAVNYAHLLGFFLGAHHNEGRKDADGRKENGGQESNEKETLLLDLIQVFTLNNNS